MIRFIILLMTLLLVSSCTDDEVIESGESIQVDNSLEEKESIINEEEVISLAEQLAIPWSIAKHGDLFYVTERDGRLLKITSDGEVTEQDLNLERDVLHYGEGGLLGLLLAPDFEESGEAYVYHTYQEGDQILNRIVLLENEGDTWQEIEVIIDQIPGAQFHNGGRLEIGPDDKLYVTTGDALNPDLAQDESSLAGKILRMNLDGTIPEDNPFDDSYVYSYGHRNPQGMTWNEDGTMYSTEHGNDAHDEINLIKPGQNYGWPVIEGDDEAEGMTPPLEHTGDTTWAPSGMDYYNGKLYIAALRGSQIIEFDLETGEAKTFYENSGRMRDIFIENGYLYTITSNRDGRGNPSDADDQLIRIPLANTRD
ncbi:PQQ-dependent sugar dehydrogenase [Piscibacillus halophilus]|uniref:PQQ-dependent sugar dehydrogenase n=1 Tax=Piscibacillus halophilus TaxID=571933 RepID=UPI00158D494B|nr:PQQ-dependent sugar dehydrogenase [Piscibacillus halophilus]